MTVGLKLGTMALEMIEEWKRGARKVMSSVVVSSICINVRPPPTTLSFYTTSQSSAKNILQTAPLSLSSLLQSLPLNDFGIALRHLQHRR